MLKILDNDVRVASHDLQCVFKAAVVNHASNLFHC